MRPPFRTASLSVFALGLALAACDDGISPDGSLNQCHGGSVTSTIALGQTADGALTNFNCRIAEARANGWFLNLSQDTRVQIDAGSEEFDALVILTDRDLNLLGFDDDSGDGTDARMWRQLPAETYILWVTSVEADQLGAYELSVQEHMGASCSETVGELSVPVTVAGELTSESCIVVADGSFADPWLLELPETTEIRIDLVSQDFNAFLVVSDLEDEWIVWDDDGGEDTNARQTVELEAGTYKVWAGTFSAGEMGAYELSVQAVP